MFEALIGIGYKFFSGSSSTINPGEFFKTLNTSSILNSRKTINKKGKNTNISVKGRHDPCVGIRAVPIAEAMMALTLCDLYLRDKAQNK